MNLRTLTIVRTSRDLYVAMQNASKLYDSTITEKTVAIMAPYFGLSFCLLKTAIWVIITI